MASDVGSFDSLWTSDIGPTPIPNGPIPRNNLETERTRGFSTQSYQPAQSNPYSQLDMQQKAAVLRQGIQGNQNIPSKSMVFISKQEMEQREQKEREEQQIEYEKQLLQLQMMQQMQQQQQRQQQQQPNKHNSLSSEKITDLFRKQQREIKDLKQTLEKVKNPLHSSNASNASNEMALLHEISRLRNLVNEYAQSSHVETERVYPSSQMSSRINYSNTMMADPTGGFWEQKKYDVLLGIIIALLCIVILMLYMVMNGGKGSKNITDTQSVSTRQSPLEPYQDFQRDQAHVNFNMKPKPDIFSQNATSFTEYKPNEYSTSSFSDIEKRLDAIVKQMANK